MKILATVTLVYLLCLPAAFASSHDQPTTPNAVAMEQETASVENSEAVQKEQFKDDVEALKATIIGRIIAELSSELEGSPDISEQDRAKIERVIDRLDNMETLADLRSLSDLTGQTVSAQDINAGGMSEYEKWQQESDSWLDALIPIVAIVFVFGAPVLIVATVMLIGYRKKRLQHATLDKFIDSGQPVPAELLASLQSNTSKNGQQKGVMYGLVGIGVGLAGWLMHSSGIGALGIIILFVGIAHLLIGKLETKAE